MELLHIWKRKFILFDSSKEKRSKLFDLIDIEHVRLFSRHILSLYLLLLYNFHTHADIFMQQWLYRPDVEYQLAVKMDFLLLLLPKRNQNISRKKWCAHDFRNNFWLTNDIRSIHLYVVISKWIKIRRQFQLFLFYYTCHFAGTFCFSAISNEALIVAWSAHQTYNIFK